MTTLPTWMTNNSNPTENEVAADESSCDYIWLDVSSLPVDDVGDIAIVLKITTSPKEEVDCFEVFGADEGSDFIKDLLQSKVEGKQPRKLSLRIFGLDDEGVVATEQEVAFSASFTILEDHDVKEICSHMNRGLCLTYIYIYIIIR